MTSVVMTSMVMISIIMTSIVMCSIFMRSAFMTNDVMTNKDLFPHSNKITWKFVFIKTSMVTAGIEHTTSSL